MAVAENAISTDKTRSPRRETNVGLASLAGGIVLLAALEFVFGVLPVLWSDVLPTGKLNNFLSGALLLIVGLVAIVGVCWVLQRMDRAFSMPGLRSGAFVAAFFIFVALWIVFSIGNVVNQDGGGMLIAGLTGAVLGGSIIWMFTRVAFGQWLVSLDDQGWFHAKAFKGNQGVRVRRATVLGVLVIGISGIITMVSHGSLGSSRAIANDWYWYVPFTDKTLYIPLLSKVNMLGPLLLGGVVAWFAWRLVNWPVFADFLIATEAEMNKVSWTTRKRLFWDTIVVLVTVVLMTTFLFSIDILWFKILNSPYVNVLQVNLKAEQRKQQDKTQW